MATTREPELDISIGPRLRAARERRGISASELARQVGVSPSLVSQIERDRATPSVKSLLAITNALGMSIDELFRPLSGRGDAGAATGSVSDDGVVQRSHDRRRVSLESGVVWERLTPGSDRTLGFTEITWPAGSATAEQERLMQHPGREYGYVLRGRLSVTIAFDTYHLEPGDTIAFESTLPHRIFNDTPEDAVALWITVGRDDSAH